MELPPLPKQYKREEAKIDGLVADWFYDNYPHDVVIEVKLKGNKTLPHQRAALKQVREGRFKYKLPDMGRRNPFDIIVLKEAQAFVVTYDGVRCHATNGYQEFWFRI